MAVKIKEEAQNPLILRSHRIMEAFAKSDDERDFYLDTKEGFLIYVDLEKSEDELNALELELFHHSERYCMIPKLSFYETKKIMESFVNEKVYDIDTREKLLDIIQSREARENFLEYVYDHHIEFEKWQQFYHERSRVRIIEWLRQNHYHFVFEEDLDFPRNMIEKLKCHLFDSKVGKDILTARKNLISKAKSYYSSEALNPRPKRGRPPKQTVKLEVEPQVSTDIFLTVPQAVHPFLFIPEISSPSVVAFSAKFDGEAAFLAHRRSTSGKDEEPTLQEFNQKLAALRSLSANWSGDDDDDDDDDEQADVEEKTTLGKVKVRAKAKTTSKSTSSDNKMKSSVKSKETEKPKASKLPIKGKKEMEKGRAKGNASKKRS